MSADVTLDDLKRQLEVIRRMYDPRAPMPWLVQMPGLKGVVDGDEEFPPAFTRAVAMIDAMTPDERRDPAQISPERQLQISASANAHPQEVELFLQEFDKCRALLSDLKRMSLWQQIKAIFGLNKWNGLTGPESA